MRLDELWGHVADHWPRMLAAAALAILLGPTPASQPLAASILSAVQSIEGGRSDAAIRWLETALVREPALAELHPLVARLALESGDPAGALRHLDVADLLLPSDPERACLRATALLDSGDSLAAIRVLEATPAPCLEQPQLLRRLIQAYLDLGEREHLLDSLGRLTDLAPEEPDAWLFLGLVMATTDPQAGLPALRRARSLSEGPDLLADQMVGAILDASDAGQPAFALAQVGQTLARNGAWRLAGWAFEEALSIEPGYVEAQAYLGLALDRSGGNGLSNLEAAARAAPQAAIPQTFLGYHWQARNRSENPAIAAEIGSLYEAMGDIATAEVSFRAATELAPRDPRFWGMLADFCLRNEIEISTLGLPAARNALALAPEDPAAMDALAYAHHLLGEARLAERLIRGALALDPLRPATQLHFGLIRQAQGDRDAALAAWELTVRLDPLGPTGELAARMARSLGGTP
jgi:tetratricopeptide (TPR) repeat protein